MAPTVAAAGRPAAVLARLLIAVALVALALVAGEVVVRVAGPHSFVDGQVYLEGGRTWAAGGSLYTAHLATPIPNFTLGFTYPPISAVLFAGLDTLSLHQGTVVLVTASLLSLYVVCLLAVRQARAMWAAGPLGRVPAPVVAVGLATLAGLLEPVQQTFSFAQINLVLMALVVVDCLAPERYWPRGALVGLAGAIKLTPLAFLLYFAARRDWRGLLTAAGSFLAVTLLGFLLAPADSREYWFHALENTSRVGNFWYAGNESLRGVLPRLGLPPGPSSVAWDLLVVLFAVVCWLAVRRRTARGDTLGSVVATGLFGLLISPVSWTHHWVWVAPALIWALGLSHHLRSIPLAAIIGACAVVFVVGPQWYMPSRNNAELHWTVWENIAGNAYVWIAAATLIAIAVARRHPQPRAPARDTEPEWLSP